MKSTHTQDPRNTQEEGEDEKTMDTWSDRVNVTYTKHRSERRLLQAHTHQRHPRYSEHVFACFDTRSLGET